MRWFSSAQRNEVSANLRGSFRSRDLLAYSSSASQRNRLYPRRDVGWYRRTYATPYVPRYLWGVRGWNGCPPFIFEVEESASKRDYE
jgi:hypothetical protein